MPTEIRFKSRAPRVAERLDPILASACRGLAGAAFSLAILVIVQLEMTSWQVGAIDESAPLDLQLMVTSP
jgi:hypothetical protein